MAHQIRNHHGIDYIEFPVADVARAKDFYAAAFGWKFNDYGPDYAGIQDQASGREVGGLSKSVSGRVGGPLVVLYSANLEESLQKVRDAGGQITKDIFEFPGGRRFHFLDEVGSELAVWSDK